MSNLFRKYVSKITYCGHIFCFPCLLQLFSAENVAKSGRIVARVKEYKCPICTKIICLDELKSVEIHYQRKRSVGDICEFSLLKRHRASTISVLASSWSTEIAARLPEHSHPHSIFCRFNYCDSPNLQINQYGTEYQILAKERVQVEAAFPLVSELERNYLLIALDQLVFKMDKLITEVKSSLYIDQSINDSGIPYVAALQPIDESASAWFEAPETEAEQTDSATKVEAKDAPSSWEELDDTPASWEDIEENTLENVHEKVEAEEHVEPSQNINSPTECENSFKVNERDYCLFFQESGGQKLFINSACLSKLMMKHGGYNNLPAMLKGKLKKMEEIKVDHHIRQRYRFLSHLPLNTICNLCDIELL